MMRNRLSTAIRYGLLVAAICTFARAGQGAEPAAPPAPTSPPAAEAAEPSEVDADAVALIQRMGDFLKAQPRFSFSVDQSYDVVQEDGEKLEFGGVRTYTVRRPDRLRIDGDARDSSARALYFDGKQIAVWVPADKAYALAKLKEPRDLDTTLTLAEENLDIQVPLSRLLRSDPTTEIVEALESAYIVGEEKLGDVECQHLALRTGEVDAQFWIATGDQPFPKRVLIEYRELEGRPRYTAQFTSWSLKPEVADSVFVFVPAAGAERVRFKVRGRELQPPEEPKP